METTTAAPRIVGRTTATTASSGASASRFIIDGHETRASASRSSSTRCRRARSPRRCTCHTREDEYSYVLEGRMGALLGDDVVEAGPGDLVFKPRNQWHTFWNAGDEPCRILEIIAPAGFERFFRELDRHGRRASTPTRRTLAALNERYGLEMRPDTVPGLLERFGLRHRRAAHGWMGAHGSPLAREAHEGAWRICPAQRAISATPAGVVRRDAPVA